MKRPTAVAVAPARASSGDVGADAETICALWNRCWRWRRGTGGAGQGLHSGRGTMVVVR